MLIAKVSVSKTLKKYLPEKQIPGRYLKFNLFLCCHVRNLRPVWVVFGLTNKLICSNSYIVFFLSCKLCDRLRCCFVFADYNCFYSFLKVLICWVLDFISGSLCFLFLPGYLKSFFSCCYFWNRSSFWDYLEFDPF